MHTDPVAVALKFGFLAVLYLFLLWVAWSALRDVAGRRRGRIVDDRDTATHGTDGLPPGLHPRLEIVAAMGHEPGTVFELNGEATLGRAPSQPPPPGAARRRRADPEPSGAGAAARRGRRSP